MKALIKSLETILGEKTLSPVVYFRLKNGEIKLVDIDNDILPHILALYKTKIRNGIIDKDDLELLNLSEADERKNVIYKYDFDREREPFLSINTVVIGKNINKFSVSKDTLENIDAIIVRIGNAKENIYLYTKFYSISLIKQDRALKIYYSDHRFKLFMDKLIQITGNFDIIRYNNEYYIKKYEILETYYHFESVIKGRTENDFERIKTLGLIENEEKLSNYLNNKTSRARKFIKVMASSKVIQNQISNDKLISFVTNHSKLKDNVKINDAGDKFVLKTNKNCDFFIKLLDDDFLKSELTEEEYEAIAKNNIK